MRVYGYGLECFTPTEIWKQYKNTNYEVSNIGRVRNKDGYIKKQQLDKYGYLVTDLYIDGKKKNVKVHRLVAETFIPNPKNKPTVNHINEIKTDNYVENLCWFTVKEQNSYGTRLQKVGKTKIGNKNNSRYSVICVELNKEFYDVPDAIRWCKENNIKANASCLYDCVNGRRKTTGGYHWKKGDVYY